MCGQPVCHRGAIPSNTGTVSRRSRAAIGTFCPSVWLSVLIPARNEEGGIGEAVQSVLEQEGVDLGVLVQDDQSTDRTAELVGELQRRDPRLNLHSAPPLPTGWCGKQHACHALAALARHFREAGLRTDLFDATDLATCRM